MAFIGESKELYGDSWKSFVCLDKEDVKIMLPMVKRTLARRQKYLDHYNDIHESGEASSRQETFRMKYEEEVQRLEEMKEVIEKYE